MPAAHMVESSRADRAQDLELLGSLGIGIEWVDRDRLTQLCSSKNHQGFAVTAKPKMISLYKMAKCHCCWY